MKKFKLLDFFADWCGPCKMLKPVVEQIKEVVEDVEVEFVNVDQNPELATQYGVMSVPTLILLKNGHVLTRRSGYAPYGVLLKWVNDVKKSYEEI